MQRGPAPNRLIAAMPNALSILRLVLAALFPLLTDRWWRIAAIVLAAFTDVADGFIARRFGAGSWAGGLLDAAADKLFALTVLIVLTADGMLDLWQTLILLSRDLVVAAIAAYAALIRRGDAFRHMPSRLLGKATTGAMFALFLVLCGWHDVAPLASAAILTTIALSIAAAADYLLVFIRVYRKDISERAAR